MKLTIACLFFYTSFCYGQKSPATIKYAGLYNHWFGNTGAGGEVVIFPETDSTVLFYIEASRRDPDYNSGARYSRLMIKGDSSVFFSKESYDKRGCQWSFRFIKNELIVKTINDCDECGFGYGVFADGIFKKKPGKAPDYFENRKGDKVYFTNTSPEKYLE